MIYLNIGSMIYTQNLCSGKKNGGLLDCSVSVAQKKYHQDKEVGISVKPTWSNCQNFKPRHGLTGTVVGNTLSRKMCTDQRAALLNDQQEQNKNWRNWGC